MQPRLFFFLTLFLLIISKDSFAIPYTWNGSVNNDWATPSNWTPVGVPGLGDDVTLSTAGSTVFLDANRTIRTLSITTTATLNLNTFLLTVDGPTLQVNLGSVNGGSIVANTLTDFRWSNSASTASIEASSQNWNNTNNNVFNGPVFVSHTGTSNSTFGSTNVYNNRFTFRTLNGRFRLEPNGGGVFNGDSLIFINESAVNESMFLSQTNSVTVNCPIRVTSSSAGNIRLGANNGGNLGEVILSSTSVIVAVGFEAGSFWLQRCIQSTPVAQSISVGTNAFVGFSDSCLFSGTMQVTAGGYTIERSRFLGAGTFTKTGGGINNVPGGNYFAGLVTIINTGNNDSDWGNNFADTFALGLTVQNLGTGLADIRIAKNATGHYISGPLLLLNASASTLRLVENASAFLRIDGDVTMESTSGGGIFWGTAGGFTQLSGQLSVGASGFTEGSLTLRNFTSNGPAFTTLNLSSATSTLTLTSSTFNQELTTSSARVFLTSNLFQQNTIFTKTGPGNDVSTGGNRFLTNASLFNNGTGLVTFGNSLPDSVAGNLTLQTASTGTITFANGGPGHWVGGILRLESTNATIFLSNAASARLRIGTRVNLVSSGSGVSFGNTGGITLLDSGAFFQTVTPGFTTGTLTLNNVSQLGTAANTMVLGAGTCNSTNGLYEGQFTVTTGRLNFTNSTFRSVCTITKSGLTGDNVTGGNRFASNLNVTLLPSSGALLFGTTSPDSVFGNLRLENQSSGILYFANTAAGNYVQGNLEASNQGVSQIFITNNTLSTVSILGNVVLENNGTGLGILFGSAGGQTLLSPASSISLGGLGFTNGTLSFRNVNKQSTSSIQLSFSGNTTVSFQNSRFIGDVRLMLGGVTFRESVFNNVLDVSRNSSIAIVMHGGNVFRDSMVFENIGTGSTQFANVLADSFLHHVLIRNAQTGPIRLASNTPGNFIQGNLILDNQSTGSIALADNTSPTCRIEGTLFLNNTGGGTINVGTNGAVTTLAGSASIQTGTLGINSGTINVRALAQTNTSAHSLLATGTATINLNNCTFLSSLSLTSPQLTFRESTFQFPAFITKTGTGTNVCEGGNRFNDSVSIVNQNTGLFRMGNTAALPDVFAGPAFFENTTTGTIELARNNVTSFENSLYVRSPNALLFNQANGTTRISGTGAHGLIDLLGNAPITNIRRWTMDKNGSFQLFLPVDVAVTVNFVQGRIITSVTNLLNIQNAATVTGASGSGFVSGPVRKTGNQAFTFPTGKGSVFAPISISAPATNTHHFTAEYFSTNPDPMFPNANRQPSIERISGCEYWNLDRTFGTSNVFVTIPWDSIRSCGVNDFSTLLLARWNGALWVNEGASNFTGNNTMGTLRSAAAISSFSPFTLGSSTPFNPLPVVYAQIESSSSNNGIVLDWQVQSGVVIESMTLERAGQEGDFIPLRYLEGSINKSQAVHAGHYKDVSPITGTNYYRLKLHTSDQSVLYSNVSMAVYSPSKPSAYPTLLQAQSQLTITGVPDLEPIEIILVNAVGQSVWVFSQSTYSSTIHLTIPSIVPGMYVLKVLKSDRSLVLDQKLVIE